MIASAPLRRLMSLARYVAQLTDCDPVMHELIARLVLDFRAQADRYLEQLWKDSSFE